jgi:hypothetical protein
VVSTGHGDYSWGSFLSSSEVVDVAIAECVDAILQSIGRDAQPELALVFVSSAYGAQYERIIPALRELVPSLKCVYGCSVSWPRRRGPCLCLPRGTPGPTRLVLAHVAPSLQQRMPCAGCTTARCVGPLPPGTSHLSPLPTPTGCRAMAWWA